MPSSQNPAAPAQKIDWGIVEKFYPGATVEEHRTKYRIYFAAARLFATKGYSGTAVREIVESAGVTKPALYYYFSNKEDLYVKLIDMAMATFSQLLERSLAFRGTRRDRLINLFSEAIQLFEGNVDLLRLVNLIFYSPTAAAPDYDLGPKIESLHLVLREMLLARSEGESFPVDGEGPDEVKIETALLLLRGLFRSMQMHIVVPELGPRLTLDQLIRGLDVVLGAVR